MKLTKKMLMEAIQEAIAAAMRQKGEAAEINALLSKAMDTVDLSRDPRKWLQFSKEWKAAKSLADKVKVYEKYGGNLQDLKK